MPDAGAADAQLAEALDLVRGLLLDPDTLVRAVGTGRRRTGQPTWRRVEVRPVDLKSGRRLQVVADDGRAATTTNSAYGEQAAAQVDTLLAQPFGSWHVETTTQTVALQVSRKGRVLLHRRAAAGEQRTAHDRTPRHLIDPGDPLFGVLGANAAKRRQVDAFLRVLDGVRAEIPAPPDRPLRVVDLGCGHAYLSFAAYNLLRRDQHVRLTGVDLREESRARNAALAAELGWTGGVDFVAGSILDAPVSPPVDLVLALHACDTATDDALAQAVRWGAVAVLASPCCHHDLQRQLQQRPAPAPYGLLTRHPILRERFGDVLTDSLRAALLRREGYRVDVVQFVGSEHTPRDTLIRAVRGGGSKDAGEYDALVRAWGVTPYLASLLGDAPR